MATTDPIKTELFRFVTLKSPNRVTKEKKELGFITHPNESKSFFLKEITSTNLASARAEVREVQSKFEPLRNYEAVRDIAPELYDFSDWLRQNASNLTYDKALAKASGIESLDKKVEILLWDNIFYDMLKRINPTVRQSCTQIIIANYFIAHINDPDLKAKAVALIQTPRTPEPPSEEVRVNRYVKRIAKSKLIIPKVFSVQRKKDNKGHVTQGKLNKVLETELLRSDAALKVSNKRKKASTIQQEIESNLGSLFSRASARSPFVKTSELNLKSVSKETADFIKSNSGMRVSPNSVRALVQKLHRTIEKETSKTVAGKRKVRLYHGKKDTKATNIPYGFVFSIPDSEDGFQLTLKLSKDEYIKGVMCHMKVTYNGQSQALKDKTFREVNATNGYALIALFENEKLNLPDAGSFEFKALVRLRNGKVVAIDVVGSLSENTHVGVGTIIKGTSKKRIEDTDEDNNFNEEIASATEDANASSEESSEEIEYGALYGVNRLGIGVYRKVEQEVCCYVPGEVSRIENIMAKEYKERHTRSLVSSETTDEEAEETEMEAQTDNATTTRNEMSSEITSAIARVQNTNATAMAAVSGGYGGVSFMTGGSVGFASSNSSTYSDIEAENFSREVTQTALERIVQKVSKKRTSRILQEFEENNRHGFDNRSGESHVTGVYRWVDIVYMNRVINYGKRLMVEFLVPEPSKLYKWAIDQELEETGTSESGAELEQPITLSENGITGPTSINRENYRTHASEYGVTGVLEPYPEVYDPETTHIFTQFDDPAFSSTGKDLIDKTDGKETTFRLTLPVTQDYRLLSMDIDIEFDYHLNKSGTEDGTIFYVDVHDYEVEFDKKSSGVYELGSLKNKALQRKTLVESHTFNDTITEDIEVRVTMKNIYDFTLAITVKEQVKDSIEDAWKEDVYYQISDAYDQLLKEYEASLEIVEAEAQAAETEKAESNPEFNRNIERREIKRSAIEMMVKPFFSEHGISVGEDYFDEGDCGEPTISQTEEWEVYSSHVKFFEQAFEWNIMDYIFYPYYWADRCSWAELLQTKDSVDPIFESFLQSGMARVVVPVREGFEDAIDLYMETGDIWNGGDLIIDTDDDLYVSVADELQEIEGAVGEEWQSRVPTTLTVIQSDSVALNASGLPCCNEVDGEVLGLIGSSETLKLIDETREEDVTVIDEDDTSETE